MEPRTLPNYLRTYRKKAGLTQQDFAFLLGATSGAQVSRYEKGHHLPPLRTVLTCEAVLGTPVSELFAGIRAEIEQDVVTRIGEFRARILNASQKGNRRTAPKRIEQMLQVLEQGRTRSQTMN